MTRMTRLNEQFLTFLETGKAVADPRPRRGRIALLAGGALVAVASFLCVSGPFFVGLALIPLALWLMVWGAAQYALAHQAQQRAVRVRQVGQHGKRVAGYLVRAHEDLYRPGSRVLPCQVLISFQPEVSGDRDYMHHLAQRWAEQTTDHERPVRYRRRRLPLALTDGSTVYCCDLFVPPALLTSGYLTGTVLPCLAEEGESGGIELVPYWLLFPYSTAPSNVQASL